MMETPTNLCGMIITHIVDQRNRKSGSLSYGMLLTILFENVGIDLTNEASQNMIHSDTYNDKSLRRMGFIKVDDMWLHKESKSGTSRTTIEEPHEEWMPLAILDTPATQLE